MTTYRIEIKSLFYKDIDADSKSEAKRIMADSVNPACSINFANNSGTFFYEPIDFKKATIIEQ